MKTRHKEGCVCVCMCVCVCVRARVCVCVCVWVIDAGNGPYTCLISVLIASVLSDRVTWPLIQINWVWTVSIRVAFIFSFCSLVQSSQLTISLCITCRYV